MGREGKRIRTTHLEVRAVASLLHHPRVGLVVPKHKQTSVDRNRLKRRLREITRLELLPCLGSVDLVIRARAEAYAAPFAELRAELRTVCERLPRLATQGEA